MARKTTPARPKAAKKTQIEKPGAPGKREKASAVHGDAPPMPPADIAEAFRRFRQASREPKTELQYTNAFTLLVAVVLSAQATDAGVNKATPALFKAADTPEKMVRLGLPKVRDMIKTIGLY